MISFIWFIIISTVSLQAVIVGSDTAPSRFYTTVTLNNGDSVAGFASLQGGFQLANSAVTATWNSLFPVAGRLNFYDGTLNLSTDLITANISSISIGNITGNGYVFDCSYTLTAIQRDGFCASTKSSSVTLSNFSFGRYTNIAWSHDDSFLTAVGLMTPTTSPGAVTVLQLDSITQQLTITAQVPNPNAWQYTSVDWHPSKHYFATVNNNNLVVPQRVEIYSVDGCGNATLRSAVAATNITDIAWQPNGFYLAQYNGLLGASAGITFYAAPDGIITSQSTALITFPPATPSIVLSSLSWSQTSSYIALQYIQGVVVGPVTTNNYYLVIYAITDGPSGPVATLNASTLVYSEANTGIFAVNGIAWNPVYTDVIAVNSSPVLNRTYLYKHDPAAGTLTLITSANGPTATLQAAAWANSGSCLALASNPNVVSGPLASILSYNNQTGTFFAGQTISDANGDPNNCCRVAYSPRNNYLALVRNFRIVDLYVPNINLNTTLSDVNLVINNDLQLRNCLLKFSGNCSIIGNNKVLSILPTAGIQIDANSQLTLRNITVQGLADQPFSRLQMLSGTSQLILDKATIVVDTKYTFTQGSLSIVEDSMLSGSGAIFAYTSTYTSSVAANSSLLLDSGLTFSYAPLSSAKNLLQFTDSTSELFLRGASLVATRTGLNLTNGFLIIDGHAYISNDAIVSGEGISLGDGVTLASNMSVSFAPAAVLEVNRGIVVNNNV